jgi:hypothetical protein
LAFSTPMLNRSVYLGAYDLARRPKVLRLELIPSNSGTEREDGNWPRPGELNGQPVGVSLCFADFANHPPGKTYEAPPIVLKAREGDVQKGP